MDKCSICGRTIQEIIEQDGCFSCESDMPFICNRCKEYEEKKQSFEILKKAMNYNKLQQQLDKSNERWKKLKEYISSQIIEYDRLTDTFRSEKNNGCVLLSLTKRQGIEEILYKMQKLEGEKDDNG